MIVDAVMDAQKAGARLSRACAMADVSKRTVERWRARPGGDDRRCGPIRRAPNGITCEEEAQVLQVLTSERYRALSPKQIVPQLADEGLYVASESSMYRIQRRHGLRKPVRGVGRTGSSRASITHRATAPNQVWSWDITWLPTRVRGRYFYLYMVVDVWSRRIVGWTVADQESAAIASSLVAQICRDAALDPSGLVLHSDNGHPMRGETMLATLRRLGIAPSFSRPHVSDDNPYSEALFRTLKHASAPAYPRGAFLSIGEVREWVTQFVAWYNHEHRHSAIRFVTPHERHSGAEAEILARRRQVYETARRTNPERWSGNTRNWSPIGTVELNPRRDEPGQ